MCNKQKNLAFPPIISVKKSALPIFQFFSTLYHKLQGPLRDIQAHILGSGVRKLWSFQKMKSLESPSRL